MRRIGVLTGLDENDPVYSSRLSAFTQALADLGWADGRNVRMDLRWAGGDINRIRALARELAGLQLDIILANSTPATVALQRETRTIPIVFVNWAIPSPAASSRGSTARVGTDRVTPGHGVSYADFVGISCVACFPRIGGGKHR
jgi:hypothetical protein